MARRLSGTTIRADGRIQKRFTIDGKRYSVYGKSNKEVQEKEDALKQKIKEGMYSSNRNVTFEKYFEEWIVRREGKIKDNSIRLYKTLIKKHVNPVIGTRKVQKIERRELIALQTKLKDKLSPVSCNTTMTIISAVLNEAVEDGIIVRNPASRIENVKDTKKASETYHRALTEEEQIAFMKAAEGDYLYEFFGFLLCTGMRSGEAAALTWEDIDYTANVIHVNKTVTYGTNNKIAIGPPKSETSKRDIPLSDTAKVFLQQRKDKVKRGLPFMTALVFPSVYGQPLRNPTINHAIKKIAKKMEKEGTKIDYFTAHALQ